MCCNSSNVDNVNVLILIFSVNISIVLKIKYLPQLYVSPEGCRAHFGVNLSFLSHSKVEILHNASRDIGAVKKGVALRNLRVVRK